MEQAEISIETKSIQTEIETLENVIEMLRLKLEQVQRKCEHPNKYQYSAQGELGWCCPDCGWST